MLGMSFKGYGDRVPLALMAASALGLGLLAANAAPQAVRKAPPGAGIYRARCASCHGAKGQGSAVYGKPLTGQKPVADLATFIARSMPPGNARKLPPAEARAVAAYIHAAFYSLLAQARTRPARIELSRLTVRQYQNVVFDLVRSFRPGPQPGVTRGLRGEYYRTGHGRGGAKERVDPEVHFDFGPKGAVPEQEDPYQFAMKWDGSVIAPDTGEYEFTVRTDQAARLWVDDMRRPLIDAYVKSGSGDEYRGTLFLLGGRAYPIKLEFSKGVVGVNNLDKVKQKPPQHAGISLEWRRPKLAPEVIPARCLSPVVTTEAFVVTTPFPPDDRSAGYERANSVSREWDDATTNAAIETEGYISERLREISGVKEDQPDRAAGLKRFCKQFVERAFRRPLTPDLARTYVDRPFTGAPNLETGVKRAILLALKSPRFLFREFSPEGGDSYDVAARLAFAMWDSLPDSELLKAAAEGQLTSRAGVLKQAERMAADPRSRSKLREFFFRWLKVDQYPDLAKDPKKYPGFDQSIATDLRTSLDLFLDQVAWSDRSDFRELFLSDKVLMNGRLAKFYGESGAPQDGFAQVEMDGLQRAGVLTHPYLLSCFSYVDGTSPIHRGVLIARSLLGRVLQPPPVAVAPTPANLHPNMTTRERVALQTRPAACMSCHNMINPLGFTLEKFDAVGRLRAQENGQPVDSSGSYESKSGQTLKFAGVRELAQYLVQSEESRGAFVEKLFQYMLKQPVQAYGPQALPALERAFSAGQFSIRQQLVETAALAAIPRAVAAVAPQRSASGAR